MELKKAIVAAAKNRVNYAKALACRISSAIIGAGTPIAVIAASPDLYFFKAEASLSTMAIIAIVIGGVSFKDSLLKFIKTPNALKVWLLVFVVAIMGQYIASQLLMLSAFALVGQGLCVPLNALDKYFMNLYTAEKEDKDAAKT